MVVLLILCLSQVRRLGRSGEVSVGTRLPDVVGELQLHRRGSHLSTRIPHFGGRTKGQYVWSIILQAIVFYTIIGSRENVQAGILSSEPAPCPIKIEFKVIIPVVEGPCQT